MRQQAILALCLVWAFPAFGIEQKVLPPIALARDINETTAGPDAGGFAPAETGEKRPSIEIRRENVPDFARVINHREIYDGAAVGGPHLLIEGVKIHTALDIYTPLPVVIRGTEISVEGGPWAVHMRPGSGPLFVSWSRIGGSQSSGAPRPVETALVLRGAPSRIYRSRLSVSGDAIHADAPDVQIVDNLIDELIAGNGTHNDAIQIAPGIENVVIRRNRILNQNPQTSCIFNEGSRITIADNYLSGGGWVIYGGASGNGHRKDGGGPAGVAVTGNVFGADYFAKSGNFGVVAYWDRANTWNNNRFADGRAIEPQ